MTTICFSELTFSDRFSPAQRNVNANMRRFAEAAVRIRREKCYVKSVGVLLERKRAWGKTVIRNELILKIVTE